MTAKDIAARALDSTYARLGEPATWFPLSGVRAEVLIQPRHETVGAEFGRAGVVANAWSCRVRAASLTRPSPQKDDRVEFNGARYRVTEAPRPADARLLEWICVLEADCS